MKKIVMILIATMAITASAQRGNHRAIQKLSADEIATLQTKKMTLALALNESQSDQVYQVNLEQVKKRKAHMEARKNRDNNEQPTKEDRLARKNEMLDAKIAVQNKMQRILTEDQFKQWRRMAKQRHQKGGQKERGRRSN